MHNMQMLGGGLLALLVAGVMPAQELPRVTDPLTLQTLRTLQNERVRLLNPAIKTLSARSKNPAQHDFKLRTVEVDQYGRTVARYDHYVQGVRVDLSEALGILGPDGRCEKMSYSFGQLLEPPASSLIPSVSDAAAQVNAVLAMGKGLLKLQPTFSELVLEPVLESISYEKRLPATLPPEVGDPTATVRVLKDWRLVRHFFYDQPKGTEGRGVIHTRVDAKTGEVISQGSTASCAPVTLMGRTYYYGPNPVAFTGDLSGSYYLWRGGLYGVHVGDVLNGLYTSPSSTYGDAQIYNAAFGPGSLNGQTQAAEIMIGLNKSYDFYKAVYGRNHFDGNNGYYVPVAAHQDNLGSGARAWWRRELGGESYWMDFRSYDGNGYVNYFGSTELSVVAHEWTHLVNYRSARVGREDGDGFEQKSLNETFSTILSTAVRLWSATGEANGIGTPNPDHWKYDWSYQPQFYGGTPESTTTVGTQCLFRPSRSNLWQPSWWTYTHEGWSDVYAAGGPLLRAYYFLANGASPVTSVEDTDEVRGRTSPFMPWGFAGIGAHNASLVFYQALTQTVGRGTNYSAIGGALETAGAQKFGAGSPMVKAIRDSLAAVNLGAPDSYAVPAAPGLTSPGTAPVVPAGEHAAWLNFTLNPGSEANYVRVTIPPLSTITFAVSSDIETTSDRNQCPGADILSEDGTQVLAHAAPIFRPARIGPYVKTVDPYVDPAPSEDPAFVYANAKATFPNNSSVPRVVLLKVQSAAVRVQGINYFGNVRLNLLDFITGSPKATIW